MALVADYSSSSSNDETSESENESEDENKPLPSLSELPGFSDIQKRKLTTNSVYSNPFIHKQEETLANLSKHTSLSSARVETVEEKKFRKRQERIKSKQAEKAKLKLCTHFFKRGTCKYGDSCKYLHSLPKDEESDSKDSTQQTEQNKELVHTSNTSVSYSSKQKSKQNINKNYMNNKNVASEETSSVVSETDDLIWEGGNSNKTRKRLGITDSVVPSKKAFAAYERLSKS